MFNEELPNIKKHTAKKQKYLSRDRDDEELNTVVNSNLYPADSVGNLNDVINPTVNID